MSKRAKQWFEQQWQLEDFLILDSETTGLGNDDQIVQLAIINKRGDVLFDNLIKPTVPVSSGAARVHGINFVTLENEPTIVRFHSELTSILEGYLVFVYNAPFDTRILRQSCGAMELEDLTAVCQWCDVMEPYARYYGAWSNYHQSYTWQSLTNACHQQEIEVVDAHNALGDCRMTLALMEKLGEVDNGRSG